MELNKCLKFNDCEKIRLIMSMDNEKYDVNGLAGDICWLCDERIDDFLCISADIEKV